MATESYIPANEVWNHPAMNRASPDDENFAPAHPSQFLPAPIPSTPLVAAPSPVPSTLALAAPSPVNSTLPLASPLPPSIQNVPLPSPPPPTFQPTLSASAPPSASPTWAAMPPQQLYQSPPYSNLPSLEGRHMPMTNQPFSFMGKGYGATQPLDIPAATQPLSSMEKGYGATQMIMKPKAPKERLQLPVALAICCIILPLILYSLTYYTLAYIRYSASLVAYIIAAICFLATLAIGAASVTSPSLSDRLWLGLLCLLSFAGCFTAAVLAERAYTDYMQPYYALQQLNVYENVNPSSAKGNQYMDFGILKFVASASINGSLATQFKNRDTYCAAPITSGSSPDSYEFWAVGMDCCSDGFRCGDWNSTAAHSGLRITGESQKQWYELAARQAAAKHNISVGQPVFVQWVTQPVASIDALASSAVLRFIKGFFLFGCIDFCIVVVSMVPFVKHWV